MTTMAITIPCIERITQNSNAITVVNSNKILMKRIRTSDLYKIFFLSACLFVFEDAFSQEAGKIGTDKLKMIKTQVENKSFVFLARSVRPMKGGTRHLTSTYTLEVDSATVVSDLPYYGRVYQAAYGGDGGIKFSSADFEYKTEVRKKGGWIIQIKTKDLRNNFQLRLTVMENGNTSLQVNGNDRESISYDGELTSKN